MDDVDREGQDSCQRLWLCNAKLYGSMVDHMMWCVSLVPLVVSKHLDYWHTREEILSLYFIRPEMIGVLY